MGKSHVQTPGAMLAFAWVTYVTVYLCRVNFASVLSKMSGQLGLSAGALGIVASVFFVTYALGQLVNGFLGDRVSPCRFLALASAGTAAMNAAVGCTSSYAVILLCWGLNGCFQSIFWGALNRILALSFPRERHSLVSTVISSSMVGGFLLSWVFLGRLLQPCSWRLYFFIPAAAAALCCVLWLALGRRELRSPAGQCSGRALSLRETGRFFLGQRLQAAGLLCLGLGLIKESLSLWAPTLFLSVLHIDPNASLLAISVIPLGNLGGMLLSKRLIDRCPVRRVLSVMIGGMLLFCLALLASDGALATVALLTLISAMSYGCNNILLSFLPLAYAQYGVVSTLIGIFDFTSYIGAAISSFALGFLFTGSRWTIIVLIWALVAAASLGLCVFGMRGIGKEDSCGTQCSA